MPRIRHLTAAIVVGLAANAAHAQTFTGVISFGDSLSDAGNYAPYIPGSGSFTTNPDDVWTQVLADAFGYTQTPYTAGGTNFAFGGAPTSFQVPGVTAPVPGFPPFDQVSCYPASLPCLSVQQQIGGYLTANGGVADPNALYTYWAGANDLFNYLTWAQLPPILGGPVSGAQVQGYIGASAVNAVNQIGALQAAGANYIVVLNLPDVGRTPAFLGTAGAGSVTGLVLIYNQTLNAGLGQLGDGIIPVNAFGLVNEVLANPTAYGFTNVSQAACDPNLMPPQTNDSSLFCAPVFYATPDANETYFFADGVHPTGAAHRILAQAVQSEIAAPGQVSMLAEFALRAGADHDAAIHNQLARGNDRGRSDDGIRGFANIVIGKPEFEATAWSPQSDASQVTLVGGADYRGSAAWRWGGAVSVTSQQLDAGTLEGDGTAVNGTLYLAFDFARGYAFATASAGNDSFDLERHIQLGQMDRVETGNTDGSRYAFAFGGAMVFGDDDFRHGPFADVTLQQIDVDAFSEDSSDSTAMTFDGYDRDSTVARLGYRLDGSAGHIRPFGQIAYNHEAEDDQTFVRAGVVSMNGHFVMPGYTPSDNWWTAEIGVGWDFNDNLSGMVSYSGLFADDVVDHNAINFGVQMDF